MISKDKVVLSQVYLEDVRLLITVHVLHPVRLYRGGGHHRDLGGVLDPAGGPELAQGWILDPAIPSGTIDPGVQP